MLTSLFGDLYASKNSKRAKDKRADDDDSDGGFAATAILQTSSSKVAERDARADRHQHDLVVSGSPAQAIRAHYAAHRAELEGNNRMISVVDPAGVWGSSVIKALSDAGGRPVERLHLREQGTLRTLATIERTTLVRRGEDMLRVVHADVRVASVDTAEIPVALMERSALTAVILGPLQIRALDAVIESLLTATKLESWRCPHVLFMLPTDADAAAARIATTQWPAHVQVRTLVEPLISASAVWNALLGLWNELSKPVRVLNKRAPSTLLGRDFPASPTPASKVATAAVAAPSKAAPQAPAEQPTAKPREEVNLLNLGGSDTTADAAFSDRRRDSTAEPLATDALQSALSEMLATEGLLACAVVDAFNGALVAQAARPDAGIDVALMAATNTQLLRAHRMAQRQIGGNDRVDEVITSAGPRQQVLRAVPRRAELFVMAVLDRPRANLALARYRLTELEKLFG